MEDNLLINLRKYRPSDKSDPLENFLTEAFAHLLKNSSEVMVALLEEIDSKSALPKAFNASSYEVSTQDNFDGKFPDMLVKWDDVVIVFEHKVYSELSYSQLDNYRAYAEEHFNYHYVVLITAREYQHKQNPDCAICWHDIHELLGKIKPLKNETAKWYLESFKGLLQAEGLGKISPINQLAITHYLEAKQLEEQMRSLIKQASLEHIPWPLAQFLAPTVKDRLSAVERRIGIEFCSFGNEQKLDWKPGIFCGFLTDGADHKFEHITGKHMHVGLIFDFQKSLHNSLQSSTTFKRLRSEIAERINELNTSNVSYSPHDNKWKVIDNLSADTNAEVNLYHPFAVLMRMDAFFSELHDSPEQLNEFIRSISSLQQLLACSGPFRSPISVQSDH